MRLNCKGFCRECYRDFPLDNHVNCIDQRACEDKDGHASKRESYASGCEGYARKEQTSNTCQHEQGSKECRECLRHDVFPISSPHNCLLSVLIIWAIERMSTIIS